jgi:hypothetical protein
MALYVPLVVLRLVKHLHAREMEAYVAENVVARVFIGRQDDPRPQIRDHSNIARAYTALGKEGVEEINGLMLHVAKDYGCADIRILASDTTAQELPMGYPNEPGILRGWAQRCGRALMQLKTRRVWGVDPARAQVQTLLRSVKEPHLCAKGKQAKRQVLTRWLTEAGQVVVHTPSHGPCLQRPRCACAGTSPDKSMGPEESKSRTKATRCVSWRTHAHGRSMACANAKPPVRGSHACAPQGAARVSPAPALDPAGLRLPRTAVQPLLAVSVPAAVRRGPLALRPALCLDTRSGSCRGGV